MQVCASGILVYFRAAHFPKSKPSCPSTPFNGASVCPNGPPPGGGESLLTLHERILKTVDELAAPHPGQQIVLVVHGGVLDVLYRAATHLSLQAPRTWQLTNTAVNRLLWTPQGLSLVGWGDTSHLDALGKDETTT
jgi:probable phosphoglycerate mutase